MPRHIAFLSAINVGGHTVKMDLLCRLFEELGLKDVETFIASGNVIFRSPAKSASLEVEGRAAPAPGTWLRGGHLHPE